MNAVHTQDFRPVQIKFAVIFLAVSAGLQIIHLALPVLHSNSYDALDIVSRASVTAGLLLFAWLISKGKNWARWIFLVVLVLGLISLPIGFHRILSLPIFRAAYFWLQTVLQVTTAVLLVVKPSNEWFRGRKDAA
jgi:fatty-acid desaturase